MKALKFLTLTVLFVSCTSDENGEKINKSLLFNKWNEYYYCESQNNLVLNKNGTFVKLHSGNTCENNTNNTYKTTGIYTVNGNKIKFTESNREVVIIGDNPPLTTQDFYIPTDLYILKLTETQFEFGSKRSATEFSNVVIYTKAVN